MWEVSPACGRTRYFPRAGKYPKGAGGVQRVHVSWPPPDPPLLRSSAPLASQGAPSGVHIRSREGRCRLRRSRSLPRLLGAGLSLEWWPGVVTIEKPCCGTCRGKDARQSACPMRTLSVEKQGESLILCPPKLLPLPLPCKGKSPPTPKVVFLAGKPFLAGKITCFSLYKRGVFCYNETQRFRTVCPGCRSLRRRTWWTAMSAPRPSGRRNTAPRERKKRRKDP